MVLRVSEDGAQGQQEKDRRVFNGEITVTLRCHFQWPLVSTCVHVHILKIFLFSIWFICIKLVIIYMSLLFESLEACVCVCV